MKMCSSNSRTEEGLMTYAVPCELHHHHHHHHLKLYHDPQLPTEFKEG